MNRSMHPSMRALFAALTFLLLSLPGRAQEPAPAILAPVATVEAAGLVSPVLDPTALDRYVAGIHVVHVASGDEVYAWRADTPMVPASTMKVVTAAAALDALGPSYTFDTDVWHTGEMARGVLAGDLYIVGGGDPTLTQEKLWKLLRQVRQDGIATIEGDLVFDDTFFDEGPLIPGWDNPRDHEEGPSYFPSIGALELDFGAAGIVIRPGPELGSPGVVELEVGAGDYLRLENMLVTSRPGSRTRIDLERRLVDDHMLFRVEGSVPLDADVRRFRRSVADPTAHVMGVVSELLDEAGVEVKGRLRRGVLPDDARLLRRVTSPSLGSVLMDTNKYSSNFMAETVLRTLGAELKGEGTTGAGLEVVREHLDALGIPRESYRVVNGSGLSRETRIPARLLTAVLRESARNPRTGPELIASLSIGGRDGTLSGRFEDHPRQVRAKTGTLAEVHALAGFFEANDGEVYAFSFLANEVHGGIWRVKDQMDAFVGALLKLEPRG